MLSFSSKLHWSILSGFGVLSFSSKLHWSILSGLYLGNFVWGGSSGEGIDWRGGGGERQKILTLDHQRHKLESNFS